MFAWLNNLITQFKLVQEERKNGRVVPVVRELGNYYITVPNTVELPYNYLKDSDEFILDMDNLPNIDIVVTSRFGGIDEMHILGTNIKKKYFNEITIGTTKNKIILWEGFLPVSVNTTLLEDFTNVLNEKNNKHVQENLGILDDILGLVPVTDDCKVVDINGLFAEEEPEVLKDAEVLKDQPVVEEKVTVKKVRKPRTKKVVKE